MESAQTYTKVAITLHWVIALLIVIQLGTGIIMGYHLVDKSVLFPMFQFHKSVGLTVLVLSILRLLWRLTHKAPPLPSTMPAWEKFGAKASHYLLYIFMIGVPLTGWLIVSSSSFGFPTSWFNLFIWPHIPGIENLPDDTKHQVNEIAENLHGWLAYSTLALLVLHVAAALKHHFIDRDHVMHHMIPWVKPKLPKAALSLALLALLSSPAQAANWTVDPAKSAIVFAGENSGEKFSGKFGAWTAEISFDEAKPEISTVKVTIDTASADTGNKSYDMTLPQKEWFDVKGHPQAVFESKEIKSLGDHKYEAKGTLTIKGITHDITLPFALTIKDGHALMTADLKLNRLDFDIGKQSDPKAEWVSQDIDLSVHLEAAQK